MQTYRLDYPAIGKRVKIARIQKDLTQEALAEATGVSPQYISRIETAADKVGLVTLVAIANTLEMGLDALLCDSVRAAESYLRDDLQNLLDSCNQYQTTVLVEAMHQLAENLKKHEPLRGE